MNFKLIITAFLSLTLISCTQKSSEPGGADSKIVNLAIWSNYISPELISEFELKTGLKVQISNYSSNEERLAKLQAGASGYDVAVPSDYMMFAMSQLGLAQTLDFEQLPHARARLNNIHDICRNYQIMPFVIS